MKIRLEAGPRPRTFLLIGRAAQDDVLFQSDADVARVGRAFGWTPCQCHGTDGTVACPHKSRLELIQEAHLFLVHHIGQEIEDPGIFK